MHTPEQTILGARLHRRMVARSPHEPHRTATPLELLFDLVFVGAVAQAAEGLHHAIANGHALEGLGGYAMVFFAIWWAWMNFSWFASAYDSDDVPYRLAVFVQIAGALIFASGVAAMLESRTPNRAIIGGYVVMRFALVAQWLRAAASDPDHRATALRYAIGVALVQVAWVSMMRVPEWWIPGFLILAACELAVPAWAERARMTTWHPHHIAERYGLFTLIVLGESIVSATMAMRAALSSGQELAALVPIAVGGLLIAFVMWWVYFDWPPDDLLTSLSKALVWGYGHYFVFASAAAVGAGLAVAVGQSTHEASISSVTAGYAVAWPVAIFLMSLWFLHDRPEYRRTRAFGPAVAILVLLTPLSGQAVPLIGALLSLMVAVKFVVMRA